MKEIIIATNNKNKVLEIAALLKDKTIVLKTINDIFEEGLEIIEDGLTFKDNALIKARTLAKLTNKLVIADDSGIVIDGLDGRPGIESSRFLGEKTSYDIKNAFILELLKDKPNRSARYVCAIAIVTGDLKEYVVEETFEGEIAKVPLGENGFGYDPIFYYPPLSKTAAQMSLEEKNEISHRAKAMKKAMKIINEMEDFNNG